MWKKKKKHFKILLDIQNVSPTCIEIETDELEIESNWITNKYWKLFRAGQIETNLNSNLDFELQKNHNNNNNDKIKLNK